MRWILTLLVVLAWHQEIYHTEVERELRALIGDINIQMQAQAAGPKEETAVLDEDALRLTSVLKQDNLGKTERMVALFYRAKARALAVQGQWRRGETMDTAMAQLAVEDLDKVIASDVDAPEWGVRTSEAQYMAGSLSLLPLKAVGRAYSYWEKCAEHDHAGCLNLMANARLLGTGGVKVD
ncbi:MAG TPA: hypothetical protein VKD24_02785, partial [Candidatus Angelobacter sp.]|nr:hypothetical protein [Candidatus Angelobacter sp.]